MNVALFPIAAAVFAVASPGQINVSVATAAPISVTSTSGGATSSQSLPAGALGATSYITTIGATGQAWASFAHSVYTGPMWAGVSVFTQAVVGNGGTSADAGSHTLLIQFQTNTPTAIELEVLFDDNSQAGSPLPRANVDIGNDGQIDYFNGQLATPGLGVINIGPQPLTIAVHVDASLSQQGYAEAGLTINVRPYNSLWIQEVALGCAGGGSADLGVAPIFADRGVTVGALQFQNYPQVMVFGFSAQPVLLPSNGSLPCLLVPSPDITIASFSSQQLSIPLPATVRPIQFWCQSVFLAGTQLHPTNCVSISAF